MDNMKALVKYIHYKMFQNTREEELLRGNHPEDDNECIRNDERISCCRKNNSLLKEIEEQICRYVD